MAELAAPRPCKYLVSLTFGGGEELIALALVDADTSMAGERGPDPRLQGSNRSLGSHRRLTDWGDGTLCVPRISSTALTAGLRSRPFSRDDHRSVPAVGVPPSHAGHRVTAAVAARGDVEYRRNPDPAPSVRRTAAAAARPGETQLGGPGPLAALLGAIPIARRQGLRLLANPDTMLR